MKHLFPEAQSVVVVNPHLSDHESAWTFNLDGEAAKERKLEVMFPLFKLFKQVRKTHPETFKLLIITQDEELVNEGFVLKKETDKCVHEGN